MCCERHQQAVTLLLLHLLTGRSAATAVCEFNINPQSEVQHKLPKLCLLHEQQGWLLCLRSHVLQILCRVLTCTKPTDVRASSQAGPSLCMAGSAVARAPCRAGCSAGCCSRMGQMCTAMAWTQHSSQSSQAASARSCRSPNAVRMRVVADL